MFRKFTVMLFAYAILAGITCSAFAQDATSGATKMKSKQGQMKTPEDKVPALTKEQQDKIDQLHMTFANMLENCVQNFNWQVGLSTTK